MRAAKSFGSAAQTDETMTDARRVGGVEAHAVVSNTHLKVAATTREQGHVHSTRVGMS